MRVDTAQVLGQGGVKTKQGADSAADPVKDKDAEIANGAEEGEAEDFSASKPNPLRKFEDKSLAPFAAKLAELKMPVRESTASAMRDLMAQHPKLSMDEAAFLASNKITGNEDMIKAALGVLSGEDKTHEMIEQILTTLDKAADEAQGKPPQTPPRQVPPGQVPHGQALGNFPGASQEAGISDRTALSTFIAAVVKNASMLLEASATVQSEAAGNSQETVQAEQAESTPERAAPEQAVTEKPNQPAQEQQVQQRPAGEQSVHAQQSQPQPEQPPASLPNQAQAPQQPVPGQPIPGQSQPEQPPQQPAPAQPGQVMPQPPVQQQPIPEQPMQTQPLPEQILQQQPAPEQTVQAQPLPQQILQQPAQVLPVQSPPVAEQPAQPLVPGQPVQAQPLPGLPIQQTTQPQPPLGQAAPQQPAQVQPLPELLAQQNTQQPSYVQPPLGQAAQQPPVQIQPLAGQPIQQHGQPIPEQPTQPQPLPGQPVQQQPTQTQPLPGQPMQQTPIPGQQQSLPGQPIQQQPGQPQPLPGQPVQQHPAQIQPPPAQSTPGASVATQQTPVGASDAFPITTPDTAPVTTQQAVSPPQTQAAPSQTPTTAQPTAETAQAETAQKEPPAMHSTISKMISEMPQFQATPQSALDRFSSMLLRIARDTGISAEGSTKSSENNNVSTAIKENWVQEIEQLATQLEKMFTKIDRRSSNPGERLREAKEELFARLMLAQEEIERAPQSVRQQLLTQTQRLMDHVRFLNSIEQFAYMQLPVQLREEQKTAELYIFKRKKGKNTDPDNVNILLSIELEFMGHWEAMLNIRGKDVRLNMEVAGEAEKEHFINNTVLLHDMLSEEGFKLIDTTINISEEKTTPLTALSALDRYISGRQGKIDFTV